MGCLQEFCLQLTSKLSQMDLDQGFVAANLPLLD